MEIKVKQESTVTKRTLEVFTSPCELRKIADSLESVAKEMMAGVVGCTNKPDLSYDIDDVTSIKILPSMASFIEGSSPIARPAPRKKNKMAPKKKPKSAPRAPKALKSDKKPKPSGKVTPGYLLSRLEGAFNNPHEYCQNPQCQSSDLQKTTNRYGTKIKCNKCDWSFMDRKKEKTS